MQMTEYEKLEAASGLIKQITRGQLEVRPSVLNHVYIHPSDDAYIGMELVLESNAEAKCYDGRFQAHVRRMGSVMDSEALKKLQAEVHQAFVLLKEFEMMEFHPTSEDLRRLHDSLAQAQTADEKPKEQMESEETEIDIMWADLRPETQERILKMLGDNGNYDVLPIATIASDGQQDMRLQ